MKRRFATVDVFTGRAFGGNPLAIVLDAEGLSSAAMQAIAAEFNYSETTFVLPPRNPAHTAQVRIFTPKSELPFAGHPNVGTGFWLARETAVFGKPVGDDLVFEEIAGLVPIRIIRNAGAVIGADITAPQRLSIGEAVPPALIAACLGLDESDVISSVHPPCVASVGTAFTIAQLRDPALLERIVVDHARFAQLPAQAHDLHVYAWDTDEARSDIDIHCRMFAPLDGIPEDPATGSANAALAALIASTRPPADLVLRIAQGDAMGRPSRLRATVSAAGIATIGGTCVVIAEGHLSID
jgi:trans-2,3-dihydro-3-hydroxyanthranilate isomerase